MLEDDKTSTNALLGKRGDTKTSSKSVVSAPPAPPPPVVNN